MPVRIRLQRHGKKGRPFYWIVAADGRAKRDGRYLEKIGTYNPNTNPAVVELDMDQAVKWLENGAQPSDTVRTLLSYRGAMMKHHLNGGVKKGAFSQEEADKRFAAWLEEKQSKIQAKIDGLDKDKVSDLAQRFKAEKAVNQKRITDLTAAPEVEENDTSNAVAEITSDESATAANETVQEELVAEEMPALETPTTEEAEVEEASVVDESIGEETAVEATKIEEVPAEETPTDKKEIKE
jgi:small subunit ribosomal protein S16